MAPQLTDESTRGVYVICPTPFAQDGALDFDSIDRLVDFYLDKGVGGFGILGEANELTPDELHGMMTRYLSPRRLRRRGAIATAHVRQPGPTLTPCDIQELDELLAYLDRALED